MDAWTYVLIAALIAHNDAVLCWATKRRFRGWGSVATGLLWPVTIPLVIVGAAILTRNMPSVSVPLTEDTP